MSLNAINLPPFMIGQMYAQSLVAPLSPDGTAPASAGPAPAPTPAAARPAAPKPQPAAATAALSFLGKNEKKILILTAPEEAVFLPDNELSFLTTVLGACQLGLADVAIVNWKTLPEKDINSLQDQLEARKILLFGIDPVQYGLPINFPVFQVQEFSGRTYMHAPPLSLIETQIPLKKQLWASLKKIFSV